VPWLDKILAQMGDVGLGGVMMVGEPSRPLLDIPVAQGRCGMIVAAGLNPMAAVHEEGMRTANRAMARLCEFSELLPLERLEGAAASAACRKKN